MQSKHTIKQSNGMLSSFIQEIERQGGDKAKRIIYEIVLCYQKIEGIDVLHARF